MAQHPGRICSNAVVIQWAAADWITPGAADSQRGRCRPSCNAAFMGRAQHVAWYVHSTRRHWWRLFSYVLRSSVCMQAILQCSILGSSIALLSGQKPAFRLLARAISLANGQPVPHIKPAVSEAFVVATPRVKSAQKVRIPACSLLSPPT